MKRRGKKKENFPEHLQSFVSRFLARARERFARNGYHLAHPSSRGNYFLLRVFLSPLVVFSIAKLLKPSLAFACSIMAFSRNESSRIFVEHALHFARIQFRTQAIVLGTKGSVISISLTINECWRTWKTSLTREKQDWPSRSSGCGDFKGLTRFMKSLLDFLSSPQSRRRQKLGGCAGRVYLALLRKTTETDWKTRPTLFWEHSKIIRKEMICVERRTQKKFLNSRWEIIEPTTFRTLVL